MDTLLLAPATGILVLFYLWMSLRIIRLRQRHKLPFGQNGDDTLQRAVRAHGNFAEYAPLGLLLWTFTFLRVGIPVINGLTLMLFVGRLSHAYSLLVEEPRTGRFRYRIAGMLLTFGMLALSALLLLVAWFRFQFA